MGESSPPFSARMERFEINGLILNGTVTFGPGAGDYRALEFGGTQTLDGTGQLVFTSGTTAKISANA